MTLICPIIYIAFVWLVMGCLHLFFVCFCHIQWYSRLCTLGSLLVYLGESYRVPWIKSGSFSMQENALPIVLSLQHCLIVSP